jgi:hypothetical protein
VKNITISLDERSLEEAKLLAAKRGLSLNRFVQDLIRRAIRPRPGPENDEFFRLIQDLKPHSGGWKWNREEIYE